ncbi:MAG TPA: hypothetical protein DF383_05975 [Deltaproteobacteria bacterium]|nr:hypothetical protein [Deltaproteobacteria bacterium]
MRFNHPDFVFLFFLIPLVLALFAWTRRGRNKAWQALADKALRPRLLPQTSPWRLRMKALLKILALAFLILALMEPQWGTHEEEVTMRGADVMILLDVSNSMLAQDLKPSRLERMKRKFSDLLGMLAGDRVGLIAFAGRSFLLSPLTIDYGTLQMFVEELKTDTIPVQGTDLSGAISLALKAMGDKDSAKAILVFSDGEDHSEKLDKIAELLREKKVKVFALGFGTPEGAPIPEPGGGFKTNPEGQMVVSKLKEEALKDLALKTGGAYVRAVTSEEDLRQLYVKGIRGALELSELKAARKQVWASRFYWPLGITCVFLLLGGLFSEVQRNSVKREE